MERDIYDDAMEAGLLKEGDPFKRIFGAIYVVHNKITKKWYVGQTRTSLLTRYPRPWYECNKEAKLEIDSGVSFPWSFSKPKLVKILFENGETECSLRNKLDKMEYGLIKKYEKEGRRLYNKTYEEGEFL